MRSRRRRCWRWRAARCTRCRTSRPATTASPPARRARSAGAPPARHRPPHRWSCACLRIASCHARRGRFMEKHRPLGGQADLAAAGAHAKSHGQPAHRRHCAAQGAPQASAWRRLVRAACCGARAMAARARAQVYLAEPGALFTAAGVPKQAVITQLAGGAALCKPPALASGCYPGAALPQHPGGAVPS